MIRLRPVRRTIQPEIQNHDPNYNHPERLPDTDPHCCCGVYRAGHDADPKG
jgi:hypothetical protein